LSSSIGQFETNVDCALPLQVYQITNTWFNNRC